MKAPRDVRTNDGFIGRGKGTALLKDQHLSLFFPVVMAKMPPVVPTTR